MFNKILHNPKRLFVLVFIVTLYGIYSGLSLPISMYPATSKPTVNMWVPYGTYSLSDFKVKFGSVIEGRIRKITNKEAKVEKLDAFYNEAGAFFETTFAWGTSFDYAKKEIESVSSSVTGLLPRSISDRIGIWQRNRNSGFLATSLYSKEMSIRELYKKINPILAPGLEKVEEAEGAMIWNPERYIVSVNLIPEKLAVYNLTPREVYSQIKSDLSSFSGSTVKVGNSDQQFEIEATLTEFKDLKTYSITHNNKLIGLNDIAVIDFSKDMHREKSFKTNGVSSLILFANPKAGANVKKMSEDVMNVLLRNKKNLPESLEFKVLVNPSQTIQSSIDSLIRDVILAAFMAVLVLFLFIGNIKSIATAAIEIPLSMVLSFILMKYFGMNLNLISLGGLALAAGMNVDASVVIMENILKHRENWAKLGKSCETFAERAELVAMSVSEVAKPVILSILTTLIVFIPMAATSGLANAVLGDLARAVIFSHAISGFVALIIVPTVRVIVLKNFKTGRAPMNSTLEKFQSIHEKIMVKTLNLKFSKLFAILTPLVIVSLLLVFIYPKLPKEVIGKPDSDWAFMSVNANNAKSGRHMENIMQKFESEVLDMYGEDILYTWFQRRGQNSGQLMFRLRDKRLIKSVLDGLKKKFKNTTEYSFWIMSWNPAELPLPKEEHFKALIKGDSDNVGAMTNIAEQLKRFLEEKDSYSRTYIAPSSKRNFTLSFNPYNQIWSNYQLAGGRFKPQDIAEVSTLSNEPLMVGGIRFDDEMTDVKIGLSDKRYQKIDSLKSFPIKLNNKLLPLSALGSFSVLKKPGRILVKDGQAMLEVGGVIEDDSKHSWESKYVDIKKDIKNHLDLIIKDNRGTIEFIHPQKELENSLSELSKSLLISVCLIFLVLWLQFQSVKQVGVIMMTIPLGLIGVLISLYAFKSYLSLNSALGIILLNGITVNNSILLADVVNSLREKGLRGKDLIITACKKRLRPILITSLTTILGMFPIAFGFGDGGKILQPLGVAVTGGLMLATFLTLFIVPILLYKNEENLLVIDDEQIDFDRVNTPIEFESEHRPIV